MAITKIIGAIHPPSSGGKYRVLKNTIDYILDPAKTEQGRFVGSVGCFTDNAFQAMIETQKRYGGEKNSFGVHERLGYHYIISFSPEEKVPPELAWKVMEEFSERLFGNQYEGVYAIHTDKKHMHGHLCFNSVNMMTGRKYRYNDGDWAKEIQPLADEICEKYGLHTLKMDTGKTVDEYEKEQKEKKKQAYYRRARNREGAARKKRGYHKDASDRYSWNDHLRLLIDDIVLYCGSMDEFYRQLKEKGFAVKAGRSQKHGDYIGLKAPGMEISRRTYQLGAEYTLESLKKRIEMANKPLPAYALPEQTILIIPIRHFAHIKIQKKLSPEMKRYFSRLYRIGVKPRNARLTYQDIKAARKKAEKAQLELELVLKYHIGTEQGAGLAVSECQKEYMAARDSLRQIQEKHRDYDMLLRRYHWYLKVRKQAEAGVRDAKLQDKFDAAEASFRKYGFTEAELQSYEKEKKAELKEASRKCTEALERLEAAEGIAEGYAGRKMEEDSWQMEMEEARFFESIMDHGMEEEPSKRAERERI